MRRTARRVLDVLAVGLASLAMLCGILILLVAYVLSGGLHQFPEGLAQQVAWFSVPLVGLAGAGYAIRSAVRHLERKEGWTGFAIGLAVALGAYGFWWELVDTFRA